MTFYLIKRLFLLVPTLFGIILINFIIVQFAPGGPVETTIAKLQGIGVESTERISGGNIDGIQHQIDNFSIESRYVGSQGLDPEIIKEIEKMYGFDKPTHVRFLKMVKNYLSFEFGNSFFQDKKVIDLIKDKLPVSISLGLWTTLLVYFISIPLGISKAVRDGFRTYMPGRSSSGRHLLRYQHLADGFLLHHVLIQPIHPRPYQLERHE